MLKVLRKIPRIRFRRRKIDAEEPEPPSPVTIYYLVLWPSIVLVFFGLLMTFSATSVSNISAGINPYGAFARTVIITVASVLVAGIVTVAGTGLINRLAGSFYAVCLLLQILVIFFGVESGGNTNWLQIPGTSQMIQPSEFLKLATVLLMARTLAGKWIDLRNWKQVALWGGWSPLVAATCVMLGRDMGTALVFVALAVGALWVAGIPRKWFVVIGIIGAFLAAFFVGVNPSRIQRVMAVFDFSNEVDLSAPTQSDHALWALGTGGLFGLGPGASREKWDYLQEAHTDFILAIVGEEFGLVGTLVLLTTVAVLIWAMLRVAAFGSTAFVRIAAGGIGSWIFFQTFVNVGTVTGLLPVIGVPFPLVSYGGSSFLATALAIGVMLCFVRSEAGFRQMSKFSATTGGRDPRVMPLRRIAWSKFTGREAHAKRPTARRSSTRTSTRPSMRTYNQTNKLGTTKSTTKRRGR